MNKKIYYITDYYEKNINIKISERKIKKYIYFKFHYIFYIKNIKNDILTAKLI